MGMIEMASRIIARFGHEGTFERPGEPSGPPWAPEPGEPTFHAATVAVVAYDNENRDGTLVQMNDVRVLVSVAGLLVIVGYIASVATMRVGDVGFVSPYRYTGMIWALLLGFVAFGEWPELPTLVGAAIVVATGLFTLYRERVTGRRDRAVAPPSTRV